MKITLTIVFITSVILSGCAAPVAEPVIVISETTSTTTTKAGSSSSTHVSPATEKPLAVPKKVVNVPEELLQPCSPLPQLLISNPTGKDVLAQKAKDVAIYMECRRKNLALITILRAAFNLK